MKNKTVNNAIYNFLGALSPIVASLIAVPLYLRVIGDARYGILTVAWLFLGYFSGADFGLSKATTQAVAKIPEEDHSQTAQVIWASFFLNLVTGLGAAVTLYVIGMWFFGSHLKMSEELHSEALSALPYLAGAVPLTMTSAVFAGAMEGRQKFGLLNLVRGFDLVLFQAAPLVVAYTFGPNLQWLVLTALGTRFLGVTALVIAVAKILHFPRFSRAPKKVVRGLLGYGSWVMVTNLAGPVLEVLDRFVIGAVSGAASVAYYTVPFNVASRLRIVPGAIGRTLFPQFAEGSAQDARTLAVRALRVLHGIITPLVVIGLVMLKPFLDLWLGAPFAQRAYMVGEIILAGVWINSLTFLPAAYLQARGHPDVVAKWHLAELLPFGCALWAGLNYFGISGAALAWDIRVSVDAIGLFSAAGLMYEFICVTWIGGLAVFAALTVSFVATRSYWISGGFLLVFLLIFVLINRRNLVQNILTVLESRSDISVTRGR